MSRGSTVAAAALALMLACQRTPARITGSDSVPPSAVESVVITAGDIAQCGNLGDEATAALVEGIDGTIAALGDNAYEQGSLDEYRNCYGPTWGRYKGRTRPALGNHEYETDGAAGHWDYWGDAAGARGRGYYSYELGSWHVVVLNSNCGDRELRGGLRPGAMAPGRSRGSSRHLHPGVLPSPAVQLGEASRRYDGRAAALAGAL